jgi:hypothetical protein
MTLLITVFAAVICTILWYRNAPKDDMKMSILCFMYWGASLMWFVDAIFEYAELRNKFFTPPLEDLVYDIYLGLSVVALGLVVWMVILLIKDPKGVMRASLFKRNGSR